MPRAADSCARGRRHAQRCGTSAAEVPNVSVVPSPPSRPLPYVGMPVRVIHLATVEPGMISDVADGGRTLTVDGVRYTLRRLNGRFVRAGEPYYGVRLSLTGHP
jgi:hypothetical protein